MGRCHGERGAKIKQDCSSMMLGLMQGRLLPPVDGHIQEFPNQWQDEFDILSECGLCCVEWLITTNSLTFNPAVKSPSMLAGLPISSVCVDTLVDERINDPKYLYSNLVSLCSLITRHHFTKVITIPLLEDSSMQDQTKRIAFIKNIADIADMFPNINFSFEAELGIKELEEIVSLRDNFLVTYDTGNITSFGLDHAEYIRTFSNKINNVHLKDRTFGAKTVEPGHGDTDFKRIFDTLKDINYSGPFILQTARSASGKEKETILRHIQYFGGLYEGDI
jgi:L-ribulose-5-phosphate 3-epimerase